MLGSLICAVLVLLLAGPPEIRSAEVIGPSTSPSATDWSALGDTLFRDARFEEAEAAYSRALDLESTNVRGHLGVGKIASMLSEPRRAASHYSAAYQADPRNPDAILAFAGIIEKPEARRTLLRNFLAFANDDRAEDVRARLRVAEKCGPEPVSVVGSPYQAYRIPLLNVRTVGLMLAAHIDGGRELRLILDTGATGIMLNRSAAAAVPLEFLADAILTGYGSETPTPARIVLAGTFEAGGLRLSRVLLHVSETDLTRQADGLIGLDVFKDFLIQVNAPGRVLDLTPFEPPGQSRAGAAPVCTDCLRAYRLGSLLLVRGTVNGHSDGYFVLDSGTRYSMVSRKLIFQEGRPATFTGAQGEQPVAIPSVPLTIHVGNRHLVDFEYATFDASGISARYGTEIAGAIGYSLLRDLTLTVDYRSGVVKLAKSGRE